MYERQVITSHRSKKRHRNGFTRSQNEHFSLTDCLDLPKIEKVLNEKALGR